MRSVMLALLILLILVISGPYTNLLHMQGDDLEIKPVWQYDFRAPLSAIDWSPDGKMLAVVAGGKLYIVFRNEKGSFIVKDYGTWRARNAVFASNSMFICGYEGVYQLKKEKIVLRIRYPVATLCEWKDTMIIFIVKPYDYIKAYRLVLGSNDIIQLYGYTIAYMMPIDMRFNEISNLLGVIYSITYGNDVVRIYDLKGFVWQWSRPGTTLNSLSWSYDGRYLAVATGEGHLYILSLDQKSVVMNITLNAPLNAVVWIKDIIFVGDMYGYLHVVRIKFVNEEPESFEVLGKVKVFDTAISMGRGIDYNPVYGLLAIGSIDGKLRIYKVSDLISITKSWSLSRTVSTVTVTIPRTVTITNTKVVTVPITMGSTATTTVIKSVTIPITITQVKTKIVTYTRYHTEHHYYTKTITVHHTKTVLNTLTKTITKTMVRTMTRVVTRAKPITTTFTMTVLKTLTPRTKLVTIPVTKTIVVTKERTLRYTHTLTIPYTKTLMVTKLLRTAKTEILTKTVTSTITKLETKTLTSISTSYIYQGSSMLTAAISMIAVSIAIIALIASTVSLMRRR